MKGVHMIQLARRARRAVLAGTYRAFREEFLARYHSGEALAPI